MWRLTVHCCDSHLYVLTRRRGSTAFSMDIRLLGPKGMNGLKILTSTRLPTSLPTTHQPSCRLQLTQLGRAHTTHPQSRPTLITAGTLQGVPPSCCGHRRGVEWAVFEPTIRVWRSGSTAACELGGGGCGGVPVHPLRLHTHRTSPAQALLTRPS
jgi:hypothetical protein